MAQWLAGLCRICFNNEVHCRLLHGDIAKTALKSRHFKWEHFPTFSNCSAERDLNGPLRTHCWFACLCRNEVPTGHALQEQLLPPSNLPVIEHNGSHTRTATVQGSSNSTHSPDSPNAGCGPIFGCPLGPPMLGDAPSMTIYNRN